MLTCLSEQCFGKYLQQVPKKPAVRNTVCLAIIAVAITCFAGRMARVGVLFGSFCCKSVAIGVLLKFVMHVVAWLLHSTAEYQSCAVMKCCASMVVFCQC